MKTIRCLAIAGCGYVIGMGGQGIAKQELFHTGLFNQTAWGQVAALEDDIGRAQNRKVVKFEPQIVDPKPLLPPKQRFDLPAIAKPRRQRVVEQAGPSLQNAKQQANNGPADNRHVPAKRQPHPHLKSRRKSQLFPGKLSRASVYELGSMGRYVHLTPAMRWHLERRGTTVEQTHRAELSSAATVTGQGAGAYYPGVSRLPVQKPFANLERPVSGLQRYWPLLLEGRENPKTGYIHWSLP